MKIASIVIVMIGVGLLAASLLADVAGIGDASGFGPQQTAGAIAGAVVTAVGLFFMFRKKRTNREP